MELFQAPTWRIIPFSKELVTTIYKPWKGRLEGVPQPYLGDLLFMVINHLQVMGWSSKYFSLVFGPNFSSQARVDCPTCHGEPFVKPGCTFPKTRMTGMENPPWMKMYFLLNMGIFQPVMSVFGGVRFLVQNHAFLRINAPSLFFAIPSTATCHVDLSTCRHVAGATPPGWTVGKCWQAGAGALWGPSGPIYSFFTVLAVSHGTVSSQTNTENFILE